MKKEFRIHTNQPQVTVTLTRDSVCAGDDCDAPHEKKITMHSFVDPIAFAQHASSGYLASVDGVGHSWVCLLNNTPIAEITHKGINALKRETVLEENNKVHFRYKSATY